MIGFLISLTIFIFGAIVSLIVCDILSTNDINVPIWIYVLISVLNFISYVCLIVYDKLMSYKNIVNTGISAFDFVKTHLFKKKL